MSQLVVLVAGIMAAMTVMSMVSGRRKAEPRPLSNLLLGSIKLLKTRIDAWQFLLRGPEIIQRGYEKAQGRPFEVHVPENRYLFVTSPEHIKEIDAASDDTLSLQAAAKQLLQPQYTMHNFNWFDRRGTDGTPLIRTLRTLLTNNIPRLLPDMKLAISGLFDELLEQRPVLKGTKRGTKRSRLYPMILHAVARVNAMAFFGPELAHDKSFMKASIAFIENTLIVAEILRLLPTFMQPHVGKFLARLLSSHQELYSTLIPVVEGRIEEYDRKRRDSKIKSHNDCIQWVMENAPRANPWSAQRIVHELMALWFGSLHVVSTASRPPRVHRFPPSDGFQTICFAAHDLCLHPEYTKPLRGEIESPEWRHFLETGAGMPLLDSFIKESMRNTPVESMSTRRLALQPFELSDGSRVEVGEWICTPPRAMMKDPANYDRAWEFHGFRFVDAKILAALGAGGPQPTVSTEHSNLTDVTGWQVWGTGRMSCPGRLYAAAVMKMTLALLITKYDCELADPRASRYHNWRSFTYPSLSLELNLRPRPEMKEGSATQSLSLDR